MKPKKSFRKMKGKNGILLFVFNSRNEEIRLKAGDYKTRIPAKGLELKIMPKKGRSRQ